MLDRLLGGGGGMGRPDLVGHLGEDARDSACKRGMSSASSSRRPLASGGHWARAGQVGRPAEVPQRREAAMLADDAVQVGVLDLALAMHHDRGRVRVEGDQRHPVLVMVVELRLLLPALDLHVPVLTTCPARLFGIRRSCCSP
jgi:hypothetical protein